jgi:hypothetical protein
MRLSAIIQMGLLAFLFGCGNQGPYQKKQGEWYWKDERMTVAPGASVTPLNSQFAKADNEAFFRSSPISGADGHSFEALNDHYAKDARRVYYCDDYRDGKEYFLIKHIRIVAIPGADAASFRMLDDYYARDSARVYFDGVPFAVADVASFEVLSYVHARDHVTGYYVQRPVPGSDGRTFVSVDEHYSKDRANVFYSGLAILNGGAGEMRNVKLPGADAASFASLGGGYGADSRAVYFEGKPMADATPPLQQLNFFYAKTATHVYYAGELMKGADPVTFRVEPTDTYTALDANATYEDGRKLKGSPRP